MLIFIIFVLCVIDLILGINLSIFNNTVIVPCPSFGEIENAETNLIRYETTQEILHITCKAGFDLIGPPKILCVDNVWETDIPKCAARCRKPPDINNGTIDIDIKEGVDKLYKKGTVATYSCNDGYLLTPPDSEYRVCEKGIWTGANASCAQEIKVTKCKPLDNIKNGYLIHERMDSDGFSIGQTVEYICNNGYKLVGDSSQQCQEDGTWIPKHPPTCISNRQTINDRLLAAKHSIAGQGLAKSVCKATTEELLGPKKKHLDYLIHCTNEPNVSIPQMANLLIERSQNTSWVVVYKALITTHHVMCYGNERFTQYLASSNVSFQLSNFVDKSGVQSAVGARTGYDMSPFIRRYARYLNEKALSYRAVAFDFCKAKRGKEEGSIRMMNAENLLKTLPILQNQLDALLEFDCTANDLTNGVINMCFMLLFRDLIRLFACYNDGVINLLEKYFEMNKKQCREALDLYKKFLIRMDRVGEFLKVAENIGIDKGDIPDLTKAPNSLLDALEQHLSSLEGNTPTSASNQKSLKSGVSVLSNTSNAFAASSQIDETSLKAAVAEEEAVFNQYKANIGSPSSTNPFLSSPEKPTAAPVNSNQAILDLFAAEPGDSVPQQQTKTSALDDLLSLGNPFADMFGNQTGAGAGAGAGAASTAPAPAPATNGNSFSGAPQQGADLWANGFATQPGFPPQQQTQQSQMFGAAQSFPAATQQFTANNLTGSVFNSNEPSVFDPISSNTAAAPAPVPQPQKQPAKLLTGDLESSLSSLVDNLTMDTSKNQWNSPKNQPKTAGWQPQPMAATTGAAYRPMGQPMMQQFPQGMQSTAAMGSPRMGAPIQQQPPKQEANFDPFGDL